MLKQFVNNQDWLGLSFLDLGSSKKCRIINEAHMVFRSILSSSSIVQIFTLYTHIYNKYFIINLSIYSTYK